MITVMLIASDALTLARGYPIAIEPQTSDLESQAVSLFQNALLLFDKHETDSAHDHMQEAIGIWERLREPQRAAEAGLQMGDRYRQARMCQGALNYYRQVIDIKGLTGGLKVNALNALALTYADLHICDLAESYFKQALEEARRSGDVHSQMLVLTGLANHYHQQGVLDKALSLVTEAQQLSKANHLDSDPALLYLTANISQDSGLLDDAKRAFLEALAINQRTGNVVGQIRVLYALSAVYLKASEKQAALEQAERAVKLAETQTKHAVTLGDHFNATELAWHACLSRARAERAIGCIDQSLNSYYWAVSYFKGLWIGFGVTTEANAIALIEEAQAAYREFIDLLVSVGRIKDAFDRLEETKARTLLTFTGARRAKRRSEDNKQVVTLLEQSRTVAHRRTELLASGTSRKLRAKLQNQIEEGEQKSRENRVDDEISHTRDRWVYSASATAEQLQKQMAEDRTTLAEFSLGEERSFLWLFTRGEVHFEILPSRREIENVVNPFIELLAATPNHLYVERDLATLREKSGALFAKLFGSLSNKLESGDRLIIVPDGVLHYLPFETLINNGRYLIDDYEFSYSPSASSFEQLQDSKAQLETGDKMELLAFGDPIFGTERKASVTRKARKRPVDVNRDARISRGFQLAPLPRTRDEVQFIASLFRPDLTRLYLGKDSTEAVVKREPLRRYRRLHFATHSLIDESSPSKSAVVLTLNDNPDEDGFLEVNEIADLDLDCDLVVLSACQTGRGQLLSGEGIVGLSRAFLYAGARSVVVSLWSVSDISTGHLMKNFYQHLAGNLRNAAALRLAKLEMLHSPNETRHPYYWAPFIAIGKP